jgi:predicted nucleic acid-binding Zn ribbon protein
MKGPHSSDQSAAGPSSSRRAAEAPRRAPMSLAELLGQSAMLSARTAHISLAEWQRAVGARLAQKTLPERLSDGVLTVRVPSSTWAQELSLLSHVVLERLQAAGHAVQRMRFQVHAETGQPERPLIAVRRAELSPSLAASLARIDDPELRHVIEEAAAYSLSRKP